MLYLRFYIRPFNEILFTVMTTSNSVFYINLWRYPSKPEDRNKSHRKSIDHTLAYRQLDKKVTMKEVFLPVFFSWRGVCTYNMYKMIARDKLILISSILPHSNKY